jgi:hypothetical protein
MALTHFKVTVGTTPIRIVTAGYADDNTRVYLANISGSYDIFLGDETVTTTDGYTLPKQSGQTIANRQEFTLYTGDSLWAISTNSADVEVLVSGAIQ